MAQPVHLLKERKGKEVVSACGLHLTFKCGYPAAEFSAAASRVTCPRCKPPDSPSAVPQPQQASADPVAVQAPPTAQREPARAVGTFSERIQRAFGEKVWLVDLPHACFGVVEVGGTIIDAAPIARWAIGRPFTEFAMWISKRDGKII